MRRLIPFSLLLMVALLWAPRFTCAANVVVIGDGIEITAENLHPWPEIKASSGHAFRADSAVYFALPAWPSDAKLAFPRLNNPTRRVYLLGKPETELPFRPEVKEWIVTLPKELPEGAKPLVVVETVNRPHLPAEPERIKPNDDSLLILPAHKAVTHGEKLRYEPQPHKTRLVIGRTRRTLRNGISKCQPRMNTTFTSCKVAVRDTEEVMSRFTCGRQVPNRSRRLPSHSS